MVDASAAGVEGGGEVSAWLSGRCVLLTGATGYVGKALLEKLLRACPGLHAVFLLVRDKRGTPPSDRIDKIFDSPLFSRLVAERPGCRGQVVAVRGELTQPQLGLSAEDAATLRERVSVVFHCGATVRFNDTLRSAALVNVGGTASLLHLAAEMTNLQALVYVSTAYCQCAVPLDGVVEERVYPVPIQPDRLVQCAEWMTDDQMETIALKIREGWPNAYSFTKACAEKLVDSYANSLPVVILRPSIVVGSWKEPIPGFCDSYGGPGTILAGFAMGMIRCVQSNLDVRADIVPLDHVVNAVIVAAWAKATNTVAAAAGRTEVYNVVSSPRNPLTWRHMEESFRQILVVEAPCDKVMWYPFIVISSSKSLVLLLRALLHFLPALVMDGTFRMCGRKPKMYRLYKKIHQQIDDSQYYMLRDWRLRDLRMLALSESLSEADRAQFPCDTAHVQWPHMLRTYAFGLRRYLLGQNPDTIPEAKRWMAKLRCAHYALLALLSLLGVRLFYACARRLFSIHLS